MGVEKTTENPLVCHRFDPDSAIKMPLEPIWKLRRRAWI